MHNNNALSEDQIWCAIPVYNNKDTLRNVVEGSLAVLKNIVVIDDGSTDMDVSTHLSGLNIKVLRHTENLGKGEAILTASRYIEKCGGIYMVTIDADGQHNPEDIRQLIPLILKHKSDLFVGCRNFDTDNVPGKSRFGRRFANFWLRVETGVQVDDCQSGFRAYPVKYLNSLNFRGKNYDFEAEVLAKFAWAGIHLRTFDVEVKYPPQEERVSHFRPFMDNLRISLVHSMLVGRRLLPIPHKRLIPKEKFDLKLLLHPRKAIKILLKEHATPEGLATSAAIGIFFAVLPLLFIHTVVILYVATRLNLNKLVAINVQHICMPPFVPALCIEIGYFMRNGRWLTDISFATVFSEFSDRLIEWFLGSVVVAPIGAVIAWVVFFFFANALNRAKEKNGLRQIRHNGFKKERE